MLAPDRLLNQKQPGDTLKTVADNMVRRRKAMHISQADLSRRSGVSLGSIRRFEQQGQISLASLVSIAYALKCEGNFDRLFAEPYYASMDDIIKANERRLREGSEGTRRRG